MTVSMEIRGIEDVNRILTEMVPKEAINLMRATVQEIAVEVAKGAAANAPEEHGELKSAIKAVRRRGKRGLVLSTVNVEQGRGGQRPFYWRFLEYGQGPDGVEHAFFLRSLMDTGATIETVYLQSFGKKLGQKLARDSKRAKRK